MSEEREGEMRLHLGNGAKPGPYRVSRLMYKSVRTLWSGYGRTIEFRIDGTEYSFRREDILYLTWNEAASGDPET
jgi:hypothetical protein